MALLYIAKLSLFKSLIHTINQTEFFWLNQKNHNQNLSCLMTEQMKPELYGLDQKSVSQI